jgi:hypothetical protein
MHGATIKIILVVLMTACYYSIYCDLIHNGDATTQNMVGKNCSSWRDNTDENIV